MSGNSLALDNVWVLSLPSFQWHQENHTPVRARTDHTCNVVGQRQMAIVGGLDADNISSPVADIWPLGLGIFDLSEMMFKDRYDADAPSYTSPEVVKRWYTEHGPMAKDINDDVKRLFVGATTVSPSASPSASAAPGGKSTSANTGAIAGGVVGGVVVLVAVVAGVWIYTRHRQRRRNRTQNARPTYEADDRPQFEVDGHPQSEIDGRQTHEKEAQERHELL